MVPPALYPAAPFDIWAVPVLPDKPTEAGEYTVLVVVAGTDRYEQATCTADFTISKRTPELSADIPNTYVGESYDPDVTTDSNGTVSILYADSNSAGNSGSFTDSKPTAAGSYTAMVTVAETAGYKQAVKTVEFTISKRTATATVSVPDTTAGESYSAVLDTDSDGASSAVIEYKVQGAANSTYSTTKPAASTARLRSPSRGAVPSA